MVKICQSLRLNGKGNTVESRFNVLPGLSLEFLDFPVIQIHHLNLQSIDFPVSYLITIGIARRFLSVIYAVLLSIMSCYATHSRKSLVYVFTGNVEQCTSCLLRKNRCACPFVMSRWTNEIEEFRCVARCRSQPLTFIRLARSSKLMLTFTGQEIIYILQL